MRAPLRASVAVRWTPPSISAYTGTRATSRSAGVKKVRRYQSATMTDVTATAAASMNTTTIWYRTAFIGDDPA
jgi:hypothetical protein